MASKQESYAPIIKKKYNFHKVRDDYGDHLWIETSYREAIPFVSYSTSKIPDVRNLYFIFALLLYKLWISVNLFLHKKKPRQPKEPKAFFIIYFQDILFLELQMRVGIDSPYSEFCWTEELKIMECISI